LVIQEQFGFGRAAEALVEDAAPESGRAAAEASGMAPAA